MAIQTQLIKYQEAGVLMEGYLAFDEKNKGTPQPTVLIAHAWEGRNEFVCGKARELAQMGYTALALDVYGKGVLGSTPEENTQLMQPLLDDRAMLQRRLLAGFQAACQLEQVDSTKVAIIGYCFGGLCALDLARTGAMLKGAASFHGLLASPSNTSDTKINAKILILHGHKDPLVPTEQVIACQQELSNAGVDWQLYTYGTAMHSFTNPAAKDPSTGLFYDQKSTDRSWKSLLNFFEEIFS